MCRSDATRPQDLRELALRGFRYALALSRDQAEAEDLLQEGWASVLSARGRWDAGYLFRATRSRWIDGYRRAAVAGSESLLHDVEDRANDPRAVDRDAVWRAFGTLRSEEREVLVLMVVEGYTASEVAALLDRPRNTVLTQAARGRDRLRAWFAAQEEAS